ncbi:carbohydrate ABC transporter permease [Paramaledivibacter caminithermalis]|jgi:multiple sugar transport system permease protein|uniref:Carbohydrate ABC transporter membrane protein 2, CUT1 family n=1 Tax=Paramaledivibacter caminithermalis (strain DSM 15212 / CIP 107654 / DViRD3) TaxID=1121301 RepID=A0A1M6QV86_PARC5|nr:carbohydrate ABC transporter permease [Paramaledivibacter caminithermalis]SHK24134.1 carbohydrate ABC transporter membrane protein 2, CUT1 family [Paramaledivibacter caminithermalis DSM 15212]
MKINYLKAIAYVILIIGGIITILPFLWMLSTSFKTAEQVYVMPPKLIPSNIMFKNYIEVLERIPFTIYFLNSIFVSITLTILTLITSIFSAFAFSKLRFWGRDTIFSIFLATMMVPGEVLIIPNYVTLSHLGWINTHLALIVPWIVSVFAIFLLRQFFLGIPDELYYAAKVDGCSDFMYIWSIMVPLAKPALITIAMLKMIYSWNEFLWPLIVTNTPKMRTLPVGLAVFTTEAGSHYHLLMAAATMIILPMIILYIILQKYIIEGVSRSGLKG